MNGITMMTNMENIVLTLLDEIHNKFWSKDNNVSTQTSRAHKLTREWQTKLVEIDADRYKAEFISNGRLGNRSHKIDLVDLKERTAYELKASPNNAHFEFYKDVFKIIYANNENKIIDKLIFCCPAAAKAQLGVLAVFVTTLSEQLDLEIDIHYISNNNNQSNSIEVLKTPLPPY
jgi:hypothetical protein